MNGGAPLGPDQDEVLLDIAARADASRRAPRSVVYDAPFTGAGTSFQTLFNAMINGGVTIISNSWAYCEDQTTLADVQSIDSILQTAAASGISVFNATRRHRQHVPRRQPEHGGACRRARRTPRRSAASSLTLGPGFTYGSETWWDGTGDTPPTGQGGFGVEPVLRAPGVPERHSRLRRCARCPTSSPTPTRQGRGDLPGERWAAVRPALLYGGTSVRGADLGGVRGAAEPGARAATSVSQPALYPLAATDAFHGAGRRGQRLRARRPGLAQPQPSAPALAGQTAGQSTTVSQVACVGAGTQLRRRTSRPPIRRGGRRRQAHVVVELRDANGNIVSGKTVTLTPSPGSSAIIAPPSGVTTSTTAPSSSRSRTSRSENVTFTATDTTDGIVLAETPTLDVRVPPAARGGISAIPTTRHRRRRRDDDDHGDAAGRARRRHARQGRHARRRAAATRSSPARARASPTPTAQIQFTATDHVNETVTYTAIDVTDGNLPVPGSAQVTFSNGQATRSCVAPPPARRERLRAHAVRHRLRRRELLLRQRQLGRLPRRVESRVRTGRGVRDRDFPNGDALPVRRRRRRGLERQHPRDSRPDARPAGRSARTAACTRRSAPRPAASTRARIVELDPTTGAICARVARPDVPGGPRGRSR